MPSHSLTINPNAGGYVMLVAGPPREDLNHLYKNEFRYLGGSARFDGNAACWRIWMPFGGMVEAYREVLLPICACVSPTEWEQVEHAIANLLAGARRFEDMSRGWTANLGPLIARLAAGPQPLHDYQTQGVHLLGRMRYGLLNDEQGMGKTRTVTALLSCLQTWPVVVVTKASCKYGWVDEIRSVDPALRVQVLEANSVVDPQAQIYILNYDIMDAHTRLTRQPLGVTLFDESQELQNDDTIRGRWSIVFGFAAQRCYLITGTPMPSRPRDLLLQLRLMRSPSALNRMRFKELYCEGELITKVNQKGEEVTYMNDSGASRVAELGAILGALTIRRIKRDFLNLPPKTREFKIVSLPFNSPYWEAHKQWRNNRRRGDAAALQAISNAIAAAAMAKVPHTIKVIQEKLELGKKVVVFSNSIPAADALAAAFPFALRLKGGTAPKRRKKIQDQFQQDAQHRLIICAMKSTAAGINLQAATVGIFNDLPWSPAVTSQAEDRIHRLGTVDSCEVIYVIARHSFDEVIQHVLLNKATLQQALEMWMRRSTEQRVEQSTLFG